MTQTDKDNYPKADGDFSKAPYVNFNDGKVKFDTNLVNNPNDNFGSASGFLPKCLQLERHPAKDAFLLQCSGRSDPTAQHPAYFIHGFLHHRVFLIVYDPGFFHQADKDTKKIKL